MTPSSYLTLCSVLWLLWFSNMERVEKTSLLHTFVRIQWVTQREDAAQRQVHAVSSENNACYFWDQDAGLHASFILHSITWSQDWEASKMPSGRWMGKLWSIQIVAPYSVLGRNSKLREDMEGGWTLRDEGSQVPKFAYYIRKTVWVPETAKRPEVKREGRVGRAQKF